MIIPGPFILLLTLSVLMLTWVLPVITQKGELRAVTCRPFIFPVVQLIAIHRVFKRSRGFAALQRLVSNIHGRGIMLDSFLCNILANRSL